MILRRLYLYLVSASALVLLAVGLTLLGSTVLLFVFNDPTADSSRSQLAIFTAMTIVAAPVWGVHFWFARRFALRDPYERSSALRRLYLYWACLTFSIAAMIALGQAIGQFLLPVLDAQTFNSLGAAQATWAAIVFVAIFGFHFWTASVDRKAAGEEGASATLRRWYMYPALLAGLLTMLVTGATVFQIAWTNLALGSTQKYAYLSWPAGLTISAALLWGFHARAIATNHIADDRHSTLRALEGFLTVAISMAAALVGASQILYYALARVLGVSNPGGASDNVLAAAAAPGSQLLVFGVAWFLIQRRLTRDAASQEADRQAGVRRLYTNLASLVSLAVWSVGAAALLWTLAEQLEAPIIGVQAGDWKNPVSLWVTLLIVGAVVWVAHWRPAPWAADRQSLSRKLYVWAALLGSILAVLAGGVGMINAVLQQLFSAHPTLASTSNLDFGHYLAVIMVAAGVGIYHWRVLRADAAARPARHADVVTTKPVAVAAPNAPQAPASVETLNPHSRRYSLVVTDATDDDVHQALASLPPQASYKLTPTEQAVDGH
ncbi:MAG TPA: DUF5671 domain-containing protein [Candidatus Dormibacteraeota bacterium]|nr:DUF5671 domain-containing protein [Candidatus Dormibacteraeota bacterium]